MVITEDQVVIVATADQRTQGSRAAECIAVVFDVPAGGAIFIRLALLGCDLS
jgi:hypothetical protein